MASECSASFVLASGLASQPNLNFVGFAKPLAESYSRAKLVKAVVQTYLVLRSLGSSCSPAVGSRGAREVTVPTGDGGSEIDLRIAAGAGGAKEWPQDFPVHEMSYPQKGLTPATGICRLLAPGVPMPMSYRLGASAREINKDHELEAQLGN